MAARFRWSVACDSIPRSQLFLPCRWNGHSEMSNPLSHNELISGRRKDLTDCALRPRLRSFWSPSS